ncbi:RNA-directed RNA polymerase [Chiqui virus]|uniref:RNA-directed RNA polymerase n=1 Tax=Chiqui virus TaxID=2250219 RepID=UPI000DC75C41|nr:RNA-directed RNA polymerase [Chiqui virus]AWX66223.1 RNA-directed RNA polymerase [Chiqui virus]
MRISEALKGKTLTIELIQAIETENFEYLTNNCEKLFTYLKAAPELIDEDFECGENSLLAKSVISKLGKLDYNQLLGKVQAFDKNWLITGKYNFDKITYQYLPTFDLKSYHAVKDSLQIEEKRVYEILLTEKTHQPRFPSTYAIWRSLFSSLLVVNTIYGESNFIYRLVSSVLRKYDKFPFHTRQNMTIWDTEDAFSSLPYVIYAINNWCDRLVYGELGIDDVKLSAAVLNWWITTSLFDSQLKWKSIFTDFVDHATQQLSIQTVREWNAEGIPVRLIRRKIKTNAYAQEIKSYKEKLSDVPISWIKDLISGLLKHTTSLTTCIVYGKVLRNLGNPALYLTSIVDLTLGPAIDPRLESTVVPKGSVEVPLSNGTIYRTIPDASTKLGRMQLFGKPIVNRAKNSFNGYSVQDKAVNFLTPQSSGRKDLGDKPEEIPDKLVQIAGTRLGDAIIHHEQLANPAYMIEGAARETWAGIREQIGRRLRAISVIPNEKLLFSFAAYTCSLEFLKYVSDASSGKQTGHYADIRQLLIGTGNQNSIVDSIDISGMDASVQPTVYSTFYDVIAPISQGERNRGANYFGFQSRTDVGMNDDGHRSEIEISGLSDAILTSRDKITPFGTSVKGKIYSLRGKDYTFPSGVAFTGTHHTIILFLGIREAEDHWKLLGNTSYLSFVYVQGDDILMIYIGDEDKIHAQRSFMASELSELGFKTTSQASPTLGVFLQQCVVGGGYMGYAERLGLCTAEKSEWSDDSIDKAQQLSALCADLSSRVHHPAGLRLLYISYCWWMFSRITLPITTRAFSEVRNFMTEMKHIRLFEVPRSQDATTYNRHTDHYIRLYAPFLMCFTEKGFQAPSLPTQRLDGTSTVQSSYLTLRGEILRRYRFDIVMDTLYHLNDERFSNEHFTYLEELGFKEADVCAEIFKRSTRNKEYKADTYFSESELFQYSERLNQYRDPHLMASSMFGAKRLRDNGIPLDDALIQMYQVPTRIRQLANAQTPTKNEDTFISSAILLSIKKLYARQKVIDEADTKFLYTLDLSENLIKTNILVNEAVVFSAHPIGPGIYYNSPMGRVLRGLGFRVGPTSDLNISASVINNKYANGLSDTRLIDAFEQVANRSKNNPSLIEYFIQATGIDRKTVQQFIRYYEYKSRTTAIRINYSANPRLYFFNSLSTRNAYATMESPKMSLSESETGYLSIIALYEFLRLSEANVNNNLLSLGLTKSLRDALAVQ